MAIATMRVPTIFTAVDRFSDVVTKMTRTTANFGATAQAAAMRTSRTFNNAGTSMLRTGAVMALGVGYAVNEAMKYEKAISNVSTLTSNSPQEMQKIGDSILEMSKKIPIGLSDMTTGMYDVVSAGITGTANQLSVLDSSARLAVAGLGTTKQAVDITTSSINAFGIDASKSSEVVNDLMKAVKYGKTTVEGISESFGAFASIMQNSNVSLKEYLASAAALTTTGMSMSRAQTQISSATTALIKPNTEMQKIYQRLGVKDVPTFIKQSGGLVGALEKVNDVAKSMGLNLGKVMGRKEGLSALLSLLGAQRGKFQEIMDDMASGTDVLGDAFAKQQETLSAKVQIMKNDLTILAIRIGDVLIPRIQSLLDTVIPNVEAFSAWSKRNEFLANTLMTVAKWTLILGVGAKVLALAFRTYAFYLGIVNGVLKVYTFVSSLAALANVSFATALWGAVSALWAFVVAEAAALAPLLLILGALGLLTYALWDTSSATDNMVSNQISALDKGNMAWVNSTNVMSNELKKQSSLINNANPYKINNLDKSTVANFNNAVSLKKQKEVENAQKVANRESLAKKGGGLVIKMVDGVQTFSGGYEIPNKENSNKENLAGSSYGKLEEYMKGKSGNLNLNINAPNGYSVETEGQVPTGINVNTTSTQGNR